MSFLDRIPGLRRLRPSEAQFQMPELLARGFIRPGKWVFNKQLKAVGILTEIHDFPRVRVMLTNSDGTDLMATECSLSDLRLAKLSEIPQPRRPAPAAGAALGYHS